MKQLYQVLPSNVCGVNPKLPRFTINVKKAGATATKVAAATPAVDYDALYQTAYNTLAEDQKKTVDDANSQTTVYACYPCPTNTGGNSDVSDWKNFVKYCTIKGKTKELEAFKKAWTQTSSSTGGTTTTTYSPTIDDRKAAITVYNAYVDDNGATTGVKPKCNIKYDTDKLGENITFSTQFTALTT